MDAVIAEIGVRWEMDNLCSGFKWELVRITNVVAFDDTVVGKR